MTLFAGSPDQYALPLCLKASGEQISHVYPMSSGEQISHVNPMLSGEQISHVYPMSSGQQISHVYPTSSGEQISHVYPCRFTSTSLRSEIIWSIRHFFPRSYDQ